MKLLIVGLIALAGWAWWSGYRVHPENLSYYVKVDVSNAQQELKLSNGTSVTGTVEEDAEEYIKLNSEGMITTHRKTQIVSMKSVAAPDFLTLMKKNYEKNKTLHPLWTHRKEDTASAKWDYAVLEPSRLAEEMKKKNPGLSQTDEVAKQMAANAQARLNDYKARQAAVQADVERG